MGSIRPTAIGLLLAAAVLAGPGRRPAAPDLLFFARHIAAELHVQCASCHSDPEMAGRFRLEPLDRLDRPDRGILLRNYRAVLAHLDPASPGKSPLLRAARGEGHPGGAIYASIEAGDYQTLLRFAMGATLHNRPPEAIVLAPRRTKTGDALQLDGTLSGDPEGDAIRYVWSVAERPLGSRAAVTGDRKESARFRTDRPGVYSIDLKVYDGRLWSLAARTRIVAAGPPPADPEAATRKGPDTGEGDFFVRTLDHGRLRLIRRLFLDVKWQPPRADEIRSYYPRTQKQRVEALLNDEEAWRGWYERQLQYFGLVDDLRPRDPTITSIPRRLVKGELTVIGALERILTSYDFERRNAGAEAFVAAVFEQCLGLSASARRNRREVERAKKLYAREKTVFYGRKSKSRPDIVRIACKQESFSRHLLRRTWRDLHRTEIGRRALDVATRRFVAEPGAFRAILAAWLAGPDYVEGAKRPRLKGRITWVRSLFFDLLGRMPGRDELYEVGMAFRSLRDPAPIRLAIARLLLSSREARVPARTGDPVGFVRAQFLRLLARPATSPETESFAAALRDDPAVTPRVVVWALISSEEYGTY